MKQKLFLLLIALLGFFQLSSIAQSYAMVIMPPRPNTNPTLFGENQYYTITFRGNGEAVVTMKAIITNTNSSPLSSTTLHLPANIQVQDILAYQVIAKPQCIQYSQEPVAQPNCLQYQQPDYQYVPNDTTYQKITIEQSSNNLTLTLPTPIKPNDTGGYLLTYRTADYTHKNLFDAYEFSFISNTVNDPINTLQVGIATDSDLYLKNAKGTVNYDNTAMKAMVAPQATGTVQSQRVNDIYNQIGQGIIVKNASDLAAGESYTTTGTYADAGIKLYGKEITTTAGIILALLILVFGTIMFVIKKQKKSKNNNNLKLFLLTAGISFGSVLLASGYTIVVFFFSTLLNNGQYYVDVNNTFLTLLLTAISGAVYLFLVFTPAIVMSIKKGLIWGGIMLGMTIMWFVIASIILFGIFYLFSKSNAPTPIVRPLMMSGQASSGSMVKTQ